MADTGLLGLYWGPRRQNREECADRWLGALLALAHHGFSSYYRRAGSRQDALRHPIALTKESVQAILAKGINRAEDTRAPIPDLGLHFAAWSGHRDGEAYSVSGTCGAWSKSVSNNFLMSLPAIGPYSISMARTPLKKAFAELITIWDPDKAILCDSNQLAWDNRRFASSMQSYERFERDAA